MTGRIVAVAAGFVGSTVVAVIAVADAVRRPPGRHPPHDPENGTSLQGGPDPG